jgi:hypothetical protein
MQDPATQGETMSAPPRNQEPGLNRRDELAVSGAAMSAAPWSMAGAAGAVVTGGDLVLHLIGGHLGLTSSVAAGVVAFFAVAGAGALLRSRSGPAMRWARANPWRFAVLPGAAAAIVVFVLSVVIGSSGLIGGTFTSLWHGAVAYGLTGVAGTVAGGRKRRT